MRAAPVARPASRHDVLAGAILLLSDCFARVECRLDRASRPGDRRTPFRDLAEMETKMAAQR